MNEKDNYLHTAELSEEQNDNMLDGILNNLPLAAPQGAGEKGAGQSEGAARPQAEPGAGGTLTARRKRDRHLHVMVTADELAQIQGRMAEAGITNAGAYMRKMALNGQGACVLTAAVCKQSQSGGCPCQHLRRVPGGDRRAPAGL